MFRKYKIEFNEIPSDGDLFNISKDTYIFRKIPLNEFDIQICDNLEDQTKEFYKKLEKYKEYFILD